MNRKIRKRRKSGIDSIPFNTLISLICAVFNLIVITILTVRATISDGNIGIISSLSGIVSVAIGGYGIYFSIKALKEDDNNYITLPLVAIISNSILTLFLIVLYIVGIFI